LGKIGYYRHQYFNDFEVPFSQCLSIIDFDFLFSLSIIAKESKKNENGPHYSICWDREQVLQKE
jgi:hypothetical protein